MVPSDCLPDDLLGRYATGELSEVEARAIDTHVCQCTLCLSRLDDLAARADSILAALRRPRGSAADDAPPVLARAVAAVLSGAARPGPEPGAVLNGYRILEEIGRGGMGRVYRVAHPRLDQEVALKLLRLGTDSAPILTRFEAERQALARMDHPNIARVLDGGATEDGRPFFVMELVRGVAITRYCDEHRLDPSRRLELFISVCRAVQHAHQKGLIHRDLKPSNVLVAEYDGRPVPKVIDFGVARAIDRQASAATEVGMLVGTPEYMSPEQADVAAQDIDTRSDIYALGVLLYELLTGETPFARRLREAPILEVLRVIREEEPPAPSARLKTAADLAEVAARRAAEPDKLVKQVRGELDWVALKALEKDRSRRYETAAALAEDVRRFLNNEPVQAGPPSRRYRLKKFVRRNRGSVLAAALVLLALVGGIAGTTAGLVRAKWERDEKQTALENLEEEQQKTQAALAAKTQVLKQAMAALNSLTDQVVERQLAGQVTLSNEDRAFLENIAGQYEALAALRGEGEESRSIRALGQLRVGNLRKKLGERTAALTCYEQARELHRQLAADFPAVPDYRRGLAMSHHNLGVLLNDEGKRMEAEVEFRHALSIYTQLADDFPAMPDYRRGLAFCHHSLGTLLMDEGKRVEAEVEFRHALALRKQLAADLPTVPVYRQELANTHDSLGTLLKGLGKRVEAEAEFRNALTLLKQLNADFPAVPDYRQSLATSHHNLGILMKDWGKRPAAEAESRHALTLLKQLAADFPTVPLYREKLASSHNSLGNLLKELGKRPAAEAEYRHALTLLKQLADDFPAVPLYRERLATSHNNLGVWLKEEGKGVEAEAEYRHALTLQKQLADDFPAAPLYRQTLANSHNNLGLLYMDQKEYEKAETEYRHALTLREQLVADFPDMPSYAVDLGGNYCNLGTLRRFGNKPAEALDWYQQAIQTLTPLVEREPQLITARRFLRNSHWGRAVALMKLKRFAEALSDWDQTVEMDDGANRVSFRLIRASCLAHLNPDKAVAEAEELIQGDKVSAGSLYSAACVYGLASARTEDVDEGDRYATRAVALLQLAHDRGAFKDTARLNGLKKNSELDSLRMRADFQKLLAELETRPQKP